jgi:hypothetical protein
MAGKEERDKRYLAAFLTCWEVFNKGDPSNTIIDTYEMALEKFSIEEIEKAFSNAIGNLRWFPKPVELLELITDTPQISIQDEATAEALLVITAMREKGAYRSVRFENPITNAVVLKGFGGWQKMCLEILEENNKWFIKDFGAIFRAYKSAGITSDSALPGIIQTDNEQLGYGHNQEVILISYKSLMGKKAKLIE